MRGDVAHLLRHVQVVCADGSVGVAGDWHGRCVYTRERGREGERQGVREGVREAGRVGESARARECVGVHTCVIASVCLCLRNKLCVREHALGFRV